MGSACARCDARIDPDVDVCPDCGNNPFRDGMLGLSGFGVILIVVSILFPTAIFVGVVLLLCAGLLWAMNAVGLAYWGNWYSPAKRDWGVLTD